MKYFKYFSREEWRLILLIGLGYFLNLFILRGQNILKKDLLDSYVKDVADFGVKDVADFGVKYAIYQAIGLMIGAFIYGFATIKFRRTTILIISTFLHLLLCILIKEFFIDATWKIYLWRLVSGVFLAGEFGIGITLISENIRRSRVLWATAITCSVGITGICAFAILSSFKIEADHIFLRLGLPLSLILLIVRWRFWHQESTVQKDGTCQNLGIIQHWRKVLADRNLFLLGMIFLPGQFSINFLIQHAKEFAGTDSNSLPYFYFYLSFCVSILVSSLAYDKTQQSRTVIRTILFIQLFAGIFFVFFNAGYYILKCLLLGLGGGLWWLSSLMTVVNTNDSTRASAVIFVTNFVRAAVVFLFFNLEANSGSNDPMFKWGAILIFLVFLGIALLVNSFFRQSFSPLLTQSGTTGRILRSDITKSIKKAQATLLETKDTKTYLKTCASILRNPIFENFNTLLFAFYSLKNNENDSFRIERSGFEQDDSMYEESDKVPTKEEAIIMRNYAVKLIEKREGFSFTSKILIDNPHGTINNPTGILIFDAPKPCRFVSPLLNLKKNPLPEGFLSFDLSNVVIEKKRAQELRTMMNTEPERMLEQIDVLATTAFNTLAEKEIKLFIEKNDSELNLRRALILHKLDSMEYKRGYFSYYIGPHYHKQNGISFLITSFPADTEKLRELSDVTTIVMNAIFVVQSQDTTYKDIIDQTMHNQNTVFSAIDSNLTGMENAFSDRNEFGFKTNMQLTRFNFDTVWRVNLLFYVLEKVNSRKENLLNLKTKAPGLAQYLKIETFPLAEIVIERLKIIQDAVENVVFELESREAAKENLHRVMIKVQAGLEGIQFRAVRTALGVILHDILTNAVRYNDSLHPELDIELREARLEKLPETEKFTDKPFDPNEYWSLSIRNKATLSEDGYKTILGREIEGNTFNPSRRLGISTIRRVLQYDGLGAATKPWFFVPQKDGFNQSHTTLFLLIHKEDVKIV